MRLICCAPVAFVVVLAYWAPNARSSEGLDQVPSIARSGDVEIAESDIQRRIASYSSKKADLVNMDLALWPTFPALGHSSEFVVHILQLQPIEDNTGKRLTTEKRLAGIKYIRGPVKPREFKSSNGKEGPVVHLRLDAPAREARSIRLIQGKIELSRSTSERLVFNDPAARSGRRLEHPSLTAFSIIPSVKTEGETTTLTLEVPSSNSQLTDWGLGANHRLLREMSQSRVALPGKDVLEKRYRGKLPDGAFIGIVFVKPTETKELDFEFRDVALP